MYNHIYVLIIVLYFKNKHEAIFIPCYLFVFLLCISTLRCNNITLKIDLMLCVRGWCLSLHQNLAE